MEGKKKIIGYIESNSSYFNLGRPYSSCFAIIPFSPTFYIFLLKNTIFIDGVKAINLMKKRERLPGVCKKDRLK